MKNLISSLPARVALFCALTLISSLASAQVTQMRGTKVYDNTNAFLALAQPAAQNVGSPNQPIPSSRSAPPVPTGCVVGSSCPSVLSSTGGALSSNGYALGGCIDPRNSLFGAVGDGSTDDTAALQAAWKYSLAHGQRCIYLPTPSVCYKISSSLNWGGFGGVAVVEGDGRAMMSTAGGSLPSGICYTSAITSSQAVIDSSNHGTIIIDGISVYPLSGTISAGACILIQPDNTGGTTSASVTHNNLQCGSGSTGEALAIIAADVSTATWNSIRSSGWGVVIGQTNGPSSVRSSFYTPVSGYGVTHISVLDNDIRTAYPPFEGTGNCGDYTIGDPAGTGYLVETSSADTTHGAIDFSYTTSGCAGFQLNLDSVNVESQGGGFPEAIVTGSGAGSYAYVQNGHWTGRLQGGNAAMCGRFYGVVANVGANTMMCDSAYFIQGKFSNPDSLIKVTPDTSKGGFKGFLYGSTIVGYHSGDFANLYTTLGLLATPNNGDVTLCTEGNGGAAEACVTGPPGFEPGVSSGGYAESIFGVLNLSHGGHISWQDAGTLTLDGSTGTSQIVTLAGSYYVDPKCYLTPTRTGTLTTADWGLQETHTSGQTWTIQVKEGAASKDTRAFSYVCPGH